MTPELLTSPIHETDGRLMAFAYQAAQIAIGESCSKPLPDIFPYTPEIAEIEKRGYQLDCWQSIERVREEGHDRALVYKTMSLGKTTIAVIDSLRFVNEFAATHGRPPRILFAAHKNEILDQASERYLEFAPGAWQSRYSDGVKDASGLITLATMQSLYLDLDRLNPKQFDYIVYDEAHHTQAETFRKVVEHFQPAFQLALTGTPKRMDRKDITELFGEPVYRKTMPEAMAEGLLADVHYRIVFDKAVRQAIDNGFSAGSLKAINQLLDNQSRNDEVAIHVLEELEETDVNNPKVIVFCQNIRQANEMAELLDGQPYHFGINPKVRRQTFRDFREGQLSVICTRDMFNEGIDIPNATHLVFLRSTGSSTVFEQQIGRGLRDHTKTVTILDFVANIERLRHIKELVDDIATARQSRGNEEDNVATTPGQGQGLQIISEHGSFDFDTVSVVLLDRLNELHGTPNRDWSMLKTVDDVADLWRSVRGDLMPTQDTVNEACREGVFVSNSKLKQFGNITGLRKALGFEVIEYEKIENMTDLAEIWDERYPGIKPTKELVRNASKAGRFPSFNIVNKHGGFREFKRQLGYDAIDYEKINSLQDLADLWQKNFPGVKPTSRLMAKAGKEAKFVSVHKLAEYGNLADLRTALGYVDAVDTKARLRAEASTIEEAAELWERNYPGVRPTKDVVDEASKANKFISRSYLHKLGGEVALKRQLGYKVDRPDPLRIASIEDLASLWRDSFGDTRPSKALIAQASKDKLFVEYRTLRNFGGLNALLIALGQETKHVAVSWSHLGSINDVASLWLEKAGDMEPKVSTVTELAKKRQFPSVATIAKYGGLRALQQTVLQLRTSPG